MNRSAALIAGLLAMLAAGWAGFTVYRHQFAATTGGIPVTAGETSAPATLAPQSPASRSAASPTRIPVQLPEFVLADLAGKATPISIWKGQSLVINFWATWCAPCRREIPLLKQLQAAWSPRHFVVIGIAADFREAVQKYAAKMAINYPVLTGEQEALDVLSSFGVNEPAFPLTVFTDNRARIVTVHLGELEKTEAERILTAIERVNLGTLELSVAQQLVRKPPKT
jgi:thiol-disulfide isomerase/thioredoxin